MHTDEAINLSKSPPENFIFHQEIKILELQYNIKSLSYYNTLQYAT